MFISYINIKLDISKLVEGMFPTIPIYNNVLDLITSVISFKAKPYRITHLTDNTYIQLKRNILVFGDYSF